MKFTRQDGDDIAKKLSASIEKGRRHEIVVVSYKGMRICQFGLRRGSRELGHDYIPKQLHISKKECRDLADCPMSADQYFERLREKGILADADSSEGTAK